MSHTDIRSLEKQLATVNYAEVDATLKALLKTRSALRKDLEALQQIANRSKAVYNTQLHSLGDTPTPAKQLLIQALESAYKHDANEVESLRLLIYRYTNEIDWLKDCKKVARTGDAHNARMKAGASLLDITGGF